MTSTLAKINHLLTPAMRLLGFELWGCQLLGGAKHRRLRVYIDKPGGVNLDDCEAANRQIKALLNVEGVLGADYALEVSSPGINRPLFKLEHYRSAIGQCVRVRLSQHGADRRNYTGTLKTIDDNVLGIFIDGQMHYLPYSDIESGDVVAAL